MAARDSVKEHYSKDPNSGLYVCVVKIEGVEYGVSMKDQGVMIRHVKIHFPDLRARQNAKWTASMS